LWGAGGAEAADDEFAFAHDSLAERACGGGGDGVPVDVFDAAAAIADEVIVLFVFGVVTGRAAFGGDFADEAGFYKVAEVVVGGGAGGARVEAVDGFEDFGGGGVFMMAHEERHDAVTLCGETKTAVLKPLTNYLGVHRKLDYV